MPFVNGKRVVLDFFANFLAEYLELWSEKADKSKRSATMDVNRRYLNLQLSQADLVLAANERQRDLWLGTMAAIGRITTSAYDADPSLRSLIDVAPFGVRPEPAIQKRTVIKGVYPGIAPDDFVLLWNGGILHWYDPTTLLQAIAMVSRTRPNLKLLFLGTKYPVSADIEGQTLTNMLALSQGLGLTGRHVFFNDGWLDYDETADYLIEADAGICTYLTNLETHFAQRVRLVDLIWAETPIICNQGDTVADLVEERKLGITVPSQDVNGLADAIVRMMDSEQLRSEMQANERSVKEELSWSRCLAPLIRYCRELPERSLSRSLRRTAVLGGSYVLGRAQQALVRSS
jgi:glycosyltransferase involved in cell wall biosynthesis